MKLNYKKLGVYIEPINHLNDGMEVKELLGISNNKYFQNSHTNTIGIDLSTYRIVRNGQFAYNRATTRNGDKISIALRQGNDCIVSPSYRIFRSKDENILNSEYLMMWFRRPEFDRYARFKSHGSAHEFFEWEQMTEVELPIPSIDKQREIVKEYNIIQNRIDLNQQLIQKLEETAQAIYREWFVEGIDWDNLPVGWRLGKLPDLIDVKYGKAYSHLGNGNIPLYGSGGLMGNVNKALYNKPSVLIPRKGTLSNIMFVNHPFWCVDTMFYSIFNEEFNGYYSYYILKQLDFDALNQGSAVPSMTTAFLNDIDVVIPRKDIIKDFNNTLKRIIKHKESIEKENQKLCELRDLLLSKISST
jgi:type I restriction enzyme S subunit